MRKMMLVAVLAVGFGGHAAHAQIAIDLSPNDPKYKTPECQAMRAKAQTFKDGMDALVSQDPGTYVIAGVMPGGTVGFLALQHRKREMFVHQVQTACMTNPPIRRDLDPAATFGK